MCFVMAKLIGSPLARTAALFIHAVTASISRTHSQCQRRGLTPLTASEPAELVSSSLEKSKVAKVALLAREAIEGERARGGREADLSPRQLRIPVAVLGESSECSQCSR